MKTPKIKRYRLGVSRTFLKKHPRKGQPTCFVEKIQLAMCKLVQLPGDLLIDLEPKLHTCRVNYPLWEKRMKAVQAGEAVIELFYWEGKPYRSKQIVFATLDKDSGCGVQELNFMISYKPDGNGMEYTINTPCLHYRNHAFDYLDLEEIAKNDGLSLYDFKSWFKGYDLSQPMAIIHFTNFRYWDETN